MATNTSGTWGNFFDVMKMASPSGGVLNVVSTLAERDDFTRLVPAYPANEGLTHHILRQTSLPQGYLVDLGGSWLASKSEYEPAVETLCTVKSTYQAPKDTFTTYKPELGQARLKAEKSSHIMALGQSISHLKLYGTTTPNQSAIVGLMKRKPWTAVDYLNCFDAGGASTNTNLRSCWLFKPGINTMHALYNPYHATLGVESTDKGEVYIGGLGTGGKEHRWDIIHEFMIQQGLAIQDYRSVKRVANVPCGPTDDPGEALVKAILMAATINAPTEGIMQIQENNNVMDLPSPWLLMCDEWLYTKLVWVTNTKLQVYKSSDNIYHRQLPMIGNDIIICRWDALNLPLSTATVTNGEAYVSAA